ncbi:MAG: AI-2E family transporter [Lutimonas sp.]
MTKLTTKNNIYDTVIRLMILFLIIAWCMMIIFPFVNVLLWSFILAMALYPLHHSLSKRLGGKSKLASFILVFSLLTLIFIPAWFLVSSMIEEVKQITTDYSNGALTLSPPAENIKEWPLIGEKLYAFWLNASENLAQTILENKTQISAFLSKIFKGVLGAASGTLQIMLALIIAGILLVVKGIGESVRKFFVKLAGDQGQDFADTTMKIVSNVVKGVIGVAAIMSLIHAILFVLADIPYAGILTLLVFILAILQIPAMLVTLPVIIYLFTVKETMPAVLWTVLLLIAGLSDNFLKPILLGKGAPVPMLVIFIGVVGGFLLSGFIGLFTGAIVLSIGYKLFLAWLNSEESERA